MSSDSDEDNVIRYGTPLEPFEEDEIPSKRKFQQQPDQYAVDAYGKRRFHGAFTGGFSAGFGNTVGSQEGWTPATFKSSRTEKAQFSNQRPEDFMDDEDRGEFGIAPRHMQTHNEFSGQKRPRQRRYHDGPIPGEPVLEQLVRTVHETAAVRMLRAMGWRDGQGTGERLTAKDKMRNVEQHKVYGCFMPPDMRQNNEADGDEDSSGSEFDYETLFAPDDYEPYILQRKNDRFGLGYSGLSRHSVLGNLDREPSHLMMNEKGRKVSIRGQAFGVGAFENDDEDIYAREDMTRYDYEIGGATDDKQKKKKNQERRSNVLEGFLNATKALPSVPSYPPPALPRDYTPLPAGSRRSRFEPTNKPQRDQGLGRHELTAEARGALLGESPLPVLPLQPPPPPPTDDPITKIVGRTVNFVTEPQELNYIPIKDSGKELIKVFKPFANNPQKQARYEMYLADKGCAFDRQGDADRLSEWERERELVEFEQAAKLYKPLTGVMGDRFTHGSEPDDALNPLTAVSKSGAGGGPATPAQAAAAACGAYGSATRTEVPWRPENLVCKRFNVPQPDVYIDKSEQKKEDRPKLSYSIFSYLESSVHDKDSFAKEQTKFSGSQSLTRETVTKTHNEKTNENQTSQKTVPSTSTNEDASASGFNKRLTVAELFLKESEKTKESGSEVTETINQFDKMDLYKSIFLSDSEDEDNKDANDINVVNERSADVNDFIDVPKNTLRNTSPPRGIFANIDFDELNSWRRTADQKTSEKHDKKADDSSKDKNTSNDKIDVKENSNANTDTLEDTAMYGPKIPENLQKRLESADKITFNPVVKSRNDESSSSDSWVDVKEVKKKHKKKKSKKHKSKHKKSKHKKKDR